jgi:hypothetical protein
VKKNINREDSKDTLIKNINRELSKKEWEEFVKLSKKINYWNLGVMDKLVAKNLSTSYFY